MAVGVMVAVGATAVWQHLPTAVAGAEQEGSEKIDEEVWDDFQEAIEIFEEQLRLLMESERNAAWTRPAQWGEIEKDTKIVQGGVFTFASTVNSIAAVTTVYSYSPDNRAAIDGVGMIAFGDKAHAVIRGVPLLVSFRANTLEAGTGKLGGVGWQCSVAEPYNSVGRLRTERKSASIGASDYATLVWEYCDEYLRLRARNRIPVERPQLVCRLGAASGGERCFWTYESVATRQAGF